MENYFLFAKWTLKRYGKCLKNSKQVPLHGHLILSFYFFASLACGLLVPWPGIEPVPAAVGARLPSHWTAREVSFLKLVNFFLLHCIVHGVLVKGIEPASLALKVWSLNPWTIRKVPHLTLSGKDNYFSFELCPVHLVYPYFPETTCAIFWW